MVVDEDLQVPRRLNDDALSEAVGAAVLARTERLAVAHVSEPELTVETGHRLPVWRVAAHCVLCQPVVVAEV